MKPDKRQATYAARQATRPGGGNLLHVDVYPGNHTVRPGACIQRTSREQRESQAHATRWPTSTGIWVDVCECVSGVHAALRRRRRRPPGRGPASAVRAVWQAGCRRD